MLFVATKFSQEEMPKTHDAGGLADLRPQDFVVVPRGSTEDVAFVATLEHKATEQIKRRRDPYPRVLRRATPEEIDAWWQRKALERKAIILCKEKARELNLDIKISHVRVDMHEARAEYHFTSATRVDFRHLVRELSTLLRLRIDLWQIGARDEARMVDGFGVCGLQTCCSSWLKEFQPVTIRMAKDQDINLPPNKLSGQCGRLLCCLAYEVDQYREMAREAAPRGATLRMPDGREFFVIDRNLVGGTYTITDGQSPPQVVKAEQVATAEVLVPAQLKKMGKSLGPPPRQTNGPPGQRQRAAPFLPEVPRPTPADEEAEDAAVAMPEPDAEVAEAVSLEPPPTPEPPPSSSARPRRDKSRRKPARPQSASPKEGTAPPQSAPPQEAPSADPDQDKPQGRRPKKRRGRH